MSLAITSQSPMNSQGAASHVGLLRFNAFDVNVMSQSQLILKKGGGVITFRDGATEITLFGFGDDTLPETGAIVTISGISQEHGPFLMPSARCSSHGEGILKGSATFIQIIAPPLEKVDIPRFNAKASVASKSGLLILKEGNAVLKSNLGATEITVFGFGEDNFPQLGAVMRIWGVSYDQGPYFLPNAKCISYGGGVLKGSATFIQLITPLLEDAGIPRPNAFDINVMRDGQPLLQEGKGLVTFRFGGTELTVFGFEQDKLPEVGSVVSIWGVSLERGHFFLSSARCVSYGEYVLKGSATFVQMIVGPTGR